MTALAPSRVGQLGVPRAHLRDDLAVPLLRRGVGPDLRRIGERARVDVVGRAPDEAVRDARRRGRSPAGSAARSPSDSNVGGGASGAVCSRGTTFSRSGFWRRNSQNVSATPRKYVARVLADRLERRVEEHVVVLVASEHRVRERDQADRLVVRCRFAGTRRAARRGSRAGPSASTSSLDRARARRSRGRRRSRARSSCST